MPPIAVSEFTAVLSELANRSGDDAAKLIGRISELATYEARAFITEAYPVLLQPYLGAAAELTAQWYKEQPAPEPEPGGELFVPQPAPLPEPSKLAISARWAITQPDAPTAIRGNAIRSVMNSSRNTVTVNANLEGVKWIRHAQPDACGFCKLLAIRTAAFYTSAGIRERTTEEQSDGLGRYELRVVGRRGQPRNRGPNSQPQSIGDKYHDNCRCTAIPIRDGSRYDPPDYVKKWQQEYDDLPGVDKRSAKDASRAMDERYRDKPRRDKSDIPVVDRPPVNLDRKRPSPTPPPPTLTETKAEIARRQLPGMEKSLADARALGLPEDSPQILWHLEQIARMKADIQAVPA
jgi:hypothetical protein